MGQVTGTHSRPQIVPGDEPGNLARWKIWIAENRGGLSTQWTDTPSCWGKVMVDLANDCGDIGVESSVAMLRDCMQVILDDIQAAKKSHTGYSDIPEVLGVSTLMWSWSKPNLSGGNPRDLYIEYLLQQHGAAPRELLDELHRPAGRREARGAPRKPRSRRPRLAIGVAPLDDFQGES